MALPSKENMAVELCAAAASGSVDHLKAFITKGYDVNAADYDQRTALHLACAVGEDAAAKYLLEQKANPNAVDRFGSTPANDAQRHDQQSAYKILTEHGTKTASGQVFGEQMVQVFRQLSTRDSFLRTEIWKEVDHFYNELDISAHYFSTFTVEEIAGHLESFIAAKKAVQATGNLDSMAFNDQGENSGTFVCIEKPNLRNEMFDGVSAYAGGTPEGKSVSITFLRSGKATNVAAGEQHHVLMAFVNRSPYPSADRSGEPSISKLGSQHMLKTLPDGNKDKIDRLIKKSPSVLCCIQDTQKLAGNKYSCAFLFPYRAPKDCLKVMTSVSDFLGLVCSEVFVYQFANNAVIYDAYLVPKDASLSSEQVESKINNFAQRMETHTVTPMWSRELPEDMKPQEKLYWGSAAIFTYYFIPQSLEDFEALQVYLRDTNAMALGRLNRLGRQMQKDAISSLRFAECVKQNSGIADAVYADFQKGRDTSAPPVSTEPTPFNEELASRIKREVTDPLDQSILLCCLTFNKNILKTNFFARDRAATAYRLDGNVVGKEFPDKPYGLFLVVGGNFHGFHLRFRDIARGGIRMVRSPGGSYQKNLNNILNENYGLAFTQQLKNKDIPEGGSKGTILLNPDAQDRADESFKQYIDCLLDVIIKNDQVVDRLGVPEILFFGPDEGTAHVMDWAAYHARVRGYPFWKAITTGKPPILGGIPHDTYGMTTRSVHQQVLGILRVHDVKEENITKFQTGGPDGDLGSNEILISKDKYIALCDGAGVICDPDGLNRPELERLAKARVMCDKFDDKKLGPKGYKVLVTQSNVKLPSGELIESGMAFRNGYHLRTDLTADLFVPCGGRPESVNINNVKTMFKEDGSPKFRFIVEGANLFFTADARRVLEDKGVVLVKDATANKGGVTSSSLEVLAALVLPPDQHEKLMCVPKGGPAPKFYEEYAQNVQDSIEEFARLEFEVDWREKQRGEQKYMHEIADTVSKKINSINDMMQASPLLDSEKFVKLVLAKTVPKKLLEAVGVDGVYDRVPRAYVKAMVGCYFASQYVYKYGLSGNEVDVLDFIQEFTSLVR